MYLFLLTVLLAFLIISASLWLASFRHAPKFHSEKADFARLLSYVLSGQANYNDWSALIHVPIRHDESLEALRRRCLEIEEIHYQGYPAHLGKPERMFTPCGLKLLEEELAYLRGETGLSA